MQWYKSRPLLGVFFMSVLTLYNMVGDLSFYFYFFNLPLAPEVGRQRGASCCHPLNKTAIDWSLLLLPLLKAM